MTTKEDSIQRMDVEVKTPPLENGTGGEKNCNDATIKESSEISTSEPNKPVTRQKHKRSRSRTPTNKPEDNKNLQMSLVKLQEEVNGDDNIKEIDEKKPEANGETENGTGESVPITKRTRHQKELSKQEEIVQKEEKEKTPQKISSSKKGDAAKKDTPTKNCDAAEKDTPTKSDGAAKKDLSKNEGESDSIEMEPLVISDEHEPELQFDEFSDKESGKGSPIIPRCVTRRSLTRNIPTPKTPKSIDQDVETEQVLTTTEQAETEDLPKIDNDDTYESSDSTKAEAGNDETRLEYVSKNITLPMDDTYLNEYREKSLTETIRCLSARRPIRESYRNRTFRMPDKSDLDAPFYNRDSIELTVSGTKRKYRSITPEETKKFKTDTGSFFTSPLASLKGKFKSDSVTSSTPMLRSYKDSRTDLHFDDNEGHTVENGLDDKKSWCSLM